MKILNLYLFLGLVVLLSFRSIGQTAYAGKPRYQIYTTRAGNPLGTINIELFQTVAPYHVKNFDSLVSKSFYDTTAFHRVIPGFMIQGGDPNSRSGPINTWGFGQPWQPKVNAEFSVIKHERGILSAARSQNINSATSQFFICVAPASNLNGQYSVYGRVTSGMDIVDSIVNSPRNMTTNNPLQKIEMFVSFNGVNDTVPSATTLVSPPTNTVGTDTMLVQLKWSKVSGALIYHLHVSHDSLFSDTVKVADLLTQQWNLFGLDAATKYYWKVKVNNGGFIVESPIWNFTTASPFDPGVLTGLEGTGFNRLKVFPNPATQLLTFSQLEAGQMLEIADIDGRIIYSEVIFSEEHHVDLRHVKRGVYFYTVTGARGQKSTGKLLLE